MGPNFSTAILSLITDMHETPLLIDFFLRRNTTKNGSQTQ